MEPWLTKSDDDPNGMKLSANACCINRWAKAFYRQQRMRGKDHQAAVRSLAFKWTRIIFQMWKRRTPYHERTYLAALQRRGSPLCHVLAEHPA
jgi:hypothetical protein